MAAVQRKRGPALYTSLDPSTALREANQVGSLQPTVLVSYEADLGPVFDTRDTAALGDYSVREATLADPGWRARMLSGQPVPTQSFASKLASEGFVGLIVRSFASGARPNDMNMVLWRWEGDRCALDVVDDENRLNRM